MRGKDLIAATLFGGAGGSSGGGGGWPEAPDDGKTRLYIALQEGRTSPMVGVCPNGTVTVDWGDGTEPDVLTGTSTSTVKWTPNHPYAAPGNYVIALTVDGEMGLSGSGSSKQYAYILRYTSGGNNVNKAYQIALRRIVIGDGVTSIGTHALYGCYALGSVTIPDSVTSINNNAFSSCYYIATLVIPGSVTSIGSSAFMYCYSAAIYDFTSHTSVPTMVAAAFQDIPADCEIRVPAALYDEWIAATNWATYASNIKAY